MGNTWVTDIRHFPGSVVGEAIPADLHPVAFRMGEFMGRIVAAATSAFWPGVRVTGLRCRRRPNRRPCSGHLAVQRDDAAEHVHWQCTHCDDNGLISGWRGSIWDLTGPHEAPVDPAQSTVVDLDDQDYGLLLSVLSTTDRDAERAVMRAEYSADCTRLTLADAVIEELIDTLVAEANAEQGPRAGLNALANRLDRAAHGRR